MNCYISLKEDFWQYGIGDDAKTCGKYSIAAILLQFFTVSLFVDDVLLIAQIEPDLYLYYAQKDGSILYDGDFCGDRNQVLELCRKHQLSYGKFELTYAPKEFSIDGAQEKTLEEVLGKSFSSLKKDVDFAQTKIKSVFPDKAKSRYYYLIAVASIIVVGIAAKTYWSFHEAEIANRLQMEQEKIALQIAQNAPKPPYQEMPLANDFAIACEHSLNQNSMLFAGWEIEELSCEGNTLVAALIRKSNGSLEEISNAYPSANFDLATNKASIQIPLGIDQSLLRNQEELPAVPSLYAYVDKVNALGIPLEFKASKAQSTLPGQEQPKKLISNGCGRFINQYWIQRH